MNGGREESLPPLVCSSICGMATLVCSQWWSFKEKGPLGVNFSSKSVLQFLFDLTFTIVITDFQTGPHFTLQMFTGIYRDSAGVFCNICREKPVIFTDFPCNPPAICKYYRVFPADIAENPMQSPCKSL